MHFSGQCVVGNSTVCIITQKLTVEAGMRLDYPMPCTCCTENIPGNPRNEINIHFLGLTYWVQCTTLTEQQCGFVCTSINAEFTSWLRRFLCRDLVKWIEHFSVYMLQSVQGRKPYLLFPDCSLFYQSGSYRKSNNKSIKCNINNLI